MAKKPAVVRGKWARIILNVLALYVLFQLIWWGYLLVETYRELYALNPDLSEAESTILLQKKIWMLIGEGIVFVILMYIGFRYLNKSIRREFRLAQMQRTFLLSVTHELKTPIAAVKLFLDTLKTRKLSEVQTTALLNDALKETKRLQSLSENILLVQRLEGKVEKLFSEEVNLSELLHSEVQRFSEIFNCKIMADIEDNIVMNGDKHLLQSLCDNLIENALKYAPAGSSVEIKARHHNHKITLEVKDSGVGIPDSDKAHIFQKFYRVGNEETRSHKGTGLGLYIAESIVKLHRGRIFAADNQPTGTIMTVEFQHTSFDEE